MTRWWLILLGIYLVIVGLLAVTNIEVVWANIIAGFCAVGAGVLILWNRGAV